jgi:tetratricopeptide (TPR) repeat protein
MKHISPKIALNAALIFVLCGCARSGCHQQSGGQHNLPPAMGVVNSYRVADSTGTGCIPQDLSADSGQTGEVVTCLEKSLARKEGARGAILAELARLFVTLGETAKKDERLVWYEKGRRYAELLCVEEPKRVEGYYWLALNLCGICEHSRAGQALSILPTIVENLELALAIDESYDQGGPLRVLGRIRCEAPSWPLSEGDLKESLNLLRIAVKIAPGNSTNHLYLAQTLIQLGETEEACAELDRARESKSHACSPSGLEEDHTQALALMTTCGSTPWRNAPETGESFARAVRETSQNGGAK